MKTELSSKAWGELVQGAEGYPAFVPKRAPRSLDLTREIIASLDEASNELGALRGLGSRLPNPLLVIAPYVRREAVLSSRIEGTQSSMADVYAAEAGQTELITAEDTQEVLNYVHAHDWGLSQLERLPLSLRLIRGVHRTLMQGVRGRERHPGEFRTYQNWIGGATGEDAVYVPPPPPQMNELLDDFERFLNERAFPPVIEAAIAHYQFEAIHPFGDGNGRVGRLLIALLLAERGVMPLPLLYLSAYFERTRNSYYDGLLRVSTDGDWQGWLRYFLRGVASQAQAAAESADRLFQLRESYRERLLAARATQGVLSLVDALFLNPVVDAARAQELLGVSAPTARAAIRTLEDEGILREVSGRRWRRTYRADEIYAAVAASPE